MAVKAEVGGVQRELSSVLAGVNGVSRALSSWQGCVDGVGRELLGFTPQARLAVGTAEAYNKDGIPVLIDVYAPGNSGENSIRIVWNASASTMDVRATLKVSNHRSGITYKVRISLKNGYFFLDEGGGTGGVNFAFGDTIEPGQELTTDERLVSDLSQEFVICHADAFDYMGPAPIAGVPNPIYYEKIQIASSYDGFGVWYPLPCGY